SYPPILSKIIKISRFMVVHKAMRLDPTAGEMMQLLQNHRMAGDWVVESLMDDPEYLYTGSQDDGYASAASDEPSLHHPQNDQAQATQFSTAQRQNAQNDHAQATQFNPAQRQHAWNDHAQATQFNPAQRQY